MIKIRTESDSQTILSLYSQNVRSNHMFCKAYCLAYSQPNLSGLRQFPNMSIRGDSQKSIRGDSQTRHSKPYLTPVIATASNILNFVCSFIFQFLKTIHLQENILGLSKPTSYVFTASTIFTKNTTWVSKIIHFIDFLVTQHHLFAFIYSSSKRIIFLDNNVNFSNPSVSPEISKPPKIPSFF